ncbi:hypothetical protein RB195_010248 [Necator americanus]|uniref:Uncharacterized protein n=1 Tax=Necator americanus TaxID=51031 RepID=A0ABR1CX31_NECAM
MKNAYCDDGGVQLEGFQIVERPLLKDIVERFLAKTSGALGDKPKLYAYSAIYHKNMTDVDDVYRYVIPDCPDPCTLDALRSTVQKYLPTDWTEECGLSGPNAINYMISTVVFALTTALLAGFIALDVALKRRRHSFATDPLMIDDDDV